MSETTTERLVLFLIRLGACLCFAGWAWGHLYWEGPYGILVWQDATYELASRWGIDWDEFVGSGANDGLVQRWLARVGWLYALCAVLAFTVRPRAWFQMSLLLGGACLLVVLSYAKYVAAQRQLPTFIEHGGQMLMPVLLIMALSLGVRHWATVGAAMLAFVMTFAGHGSYALGLWPTPANFFGMTSVVLGVEYETARSILRLAGVLDMLVCVGIFLPPLRRTCALYGALWGLLTALARPVAGMAWSLNYWGADQFVHEAVLRAPHCLIPLSLFFLWRKAPETGGVPNSLESHPDRSTSNPTQIGMTS